MGWVVIVTAFDNSERRESITAVKELVEALEEQTRLQEKHTLATGIGPGYPMKKGAILTEAAFAEMKRVERRVKEAHE